MSTYTERESALVKKRNDRLESMNPYTAVNKAEVDQLRVAGEWTLLNLKNWWGYPPLYYAVLNKNDEVVTELLKDGATMDEMIYRVNDTC